MLHDDPSFLPDFAFGNLEMNLSNLEIPTDASSRSESILSPHSGHSSRTSQDLGPGIIIPGSSSDMAPGFGAFDLPVAASSDNEAAGEE